MKVKHLFILEQADLLRMRAGEMLQPDDRTIITVDRSLLGRPGRPSKAELPALEHNPQGPKPQPVIHLKPRSDGKFQCPKCPKVLPNLPSMRGHLGAHARGKIKS